MIRTVLAVGLAATLFSACGLRGELERPAPLWGNPPNEGPLDPRTIKAAEEAAAAEKARQDAERKATDDARRQQLQQQATPPARPQ